MEREERGDILNNIFDQRKKQAELQASIAEAKTHIPQIQADLASLVTNNITQETIEISPEKWFNRTFDSAIEVAQFGKQKLETKLTGSIQEPDEESIKVEISTNLFSSEEEPRSPEKSHFLMDVEGHPSYFIVNGAEITVESKERESRHYDPMTTPIGSRIPSWPKYRYPASMKDVESYEQLIHVLQNGNVTFTGEAPQRYIVKRDTPPRRQPRRRQ